ncbi:MAG TPA: hypothetical protein VF453_12915, partial [Burkholderiaceae bacterium]
GPAVAAAEPSRAADAEAPPDAPARPRSKGPEDSIPRLSHASLAHEGRIRPAGVAYFTLRRDSAGAASRDVADASPPTFPAGAREADRRRWRRAPAWAALRIAPWQAAPSANSFA